jgi:hypothetical protein
MSHQHTQKIISRFLLELFVQKNKNYYYCKHTLKQIQVKIGFGSSVHKLALAGD